MRWIWISILMNTLTGCQNLIAGGGDLFSGENEVVYVAAGAGIAAPVPSDPGIKNGECFSVSLAQVGIQSVTESWFLRLNHHAPSGQVGVFLNVQQPSLGIVGQEAVAASPHDPGRLVYYDEDARDATYLNLSNLEILPPTLYGGDGILINATILEFDGDQFRGYKNNAESIITISTALSGYGAAATPIIKKASDAFLAQYENNDVMLSYTGRISHPHLGWYIIWRTPPHSADYRPVRSLDAQGNPIDADKKRTEAIGSPVGLTFDAGRERVTVPDDPKEVRRDATYMVLRLDPHDPARCHGQPTK